MGSGRLCIHIFFFLGFVVFNYVHVGMPVCANECGVLGGQKRVFDALELELEATESHLTWVLRKSSNH